ncbi:MAG: RHS repeat-associated core domain-containing protein, partial [Deltaproteobacteria bacterium]
ASGNTLAECDSPTDPTCQTDHDHLKAYAWDEESWLTQSVTGGGRYTRYLYDGSGQRVVKVGDHGPEIEVGQFFTLEGKIHATKHVFAGETRLASKLIETDVWKRQAGAGGNGGPGIANPGLSSPGTSGGGSGGGGTGGNGKGKGNSGGSNGGGSGPQNQNGCDPSNYQPQKCVFVAASNPVGSSAAGDADDLVRPVTYYYHPDHLGSTQWVTDQNALVHEHVEYYPYGQVWRDPKSDDDRGPTVQGQQFLFTSKQYDPETGNYYFGARYYDPRLARWLSVDPALPGNAFEMPAALAAYMYGQDNPIRFLDPDGRQDIDEGVADAQQARQSEAQSVKESFAKAGPFVEAALTLNPLIGGAVAVTGERATGGKASTAERVMAGASVVAPFLGTILGRAARFLGIGGSEATEVGQAAVAGAESASIGGAETVRIGQAGEEAVRASVDIGPKVRIKIAPGRYRIPDGLTSNALSEVKNVQSLSFTQQLRDYARFAQQKGLQFDLYVRGPIRI